MLKAGIIGATGYAGAELLRLLLGHPQVGEILVGSTSQTGQPLSAVYPSFYGIYEGALLSPEDVIEKSDVIFASVPHGVSQEFAHMARGKVFIDLGADFRLDSEADYAAWYGGSFTHQDLHKESVYGLCELNRADIAKTKLIANPGCYPTSVALGLFPALKNDLIETTGIVIDAKSGVTGAGKSLSEDTHFANLNEGFHPYKVASHRHTPEIEQTLSIMAKKDVTVLFTPHLLPINRGILSTIYTKPKADFETIYNAYVDHYASEQFVKVLPKGKIADLKHVKQSNYCHISLHFDERTHTLIVVSVIDNMVKGAAGAAVQNMNIALGLKESLGLTAVSPVI